MKPPQPSAGQEPEPTVASDRMPPKLRRLHRAHGLALIVVASLASLHHGLVHDQIKRRSADAATVNVAGYQRTLTQKIAKAALRTKGVDEEAALARMELTLSLEQLVSGEDELGYILETGDLKDSDCVRSAFRNLGPHYARFVSAAQVVASGEDPAQVDAARNELLEHEDALLEHLDVLVKMYELESVHRLNSLQLLGLLVGGVKLLVLVAVAVGLFRPVMKRLEREMRLREETDLKLHRRNEALVESLLATREAEGFLVEVLRYAADPVIAIDKVGTVVMASEAVRRVFQWEPEELLGQDVAVLMPEPHRSQHGGYLRRYFETGKSELIGRMRPINAQRRDGSPVPVELAVARVESSRTPLFVGVVRDISSRVQLEEELEQARHLESVGRLAAGIAHEINTPTQYVGDNTRFVDDGVRDLMPLLTRAEELVDSVQRGADSSRIAQALKEELSAVDLEYLSEEMPKALAQSLSGLDRVRHIVQSMKEYAHPGAEGMTDVDLNRAIESTVTLASNEWKYVAELETDLDPSLPLVPCLPAEFNQVVLNMIVNAAHAIEEVVGDGLNHKGEIRISTRRREEYAEIRIADTGAGIPEHARASIFEPFFTTKEVGKGTGQGLALAYGVIVNKHGGKIEVETETGEGTTFVIRIPLHRQEAEAIL